MAEDYHGLIALPSPGVAVGDVSGRRRTGFGSMARVNKMQDLPPVLSAWGMGGPALAQGLSHSAKVFEQMEIDRQQIESIQVQDEFMDTEREQLRAIMERKGQGAVNSVADMNAFYDEQGRNVLSKARGTYQQGLYENFMKQRRATGLNAATNHEISEHENYKKEFLQGQADRRDRAIAENPDAWHRLAGEYDQQERTLNPDREPGLADAFSQKVRDEAALKGVITKVDQHDFIGAQILKDGWDNPTLPSGAEPYASIINKASETYGVPSNIIAAVMQTESGFRPGATSPTGVKGLMQVTQATYTGLGFTGDRSDPENSTMAGAKLLGQLYQQYKSWPEALAAYNGGPDAVRGLRSGNWGIWSGNSSKQREIRNYAPTVMKHLGGDQQNKTSTNPEMSIQMDNIIKNGQNQFAAANKDGVKNFIDQVKNHIDGILEGGVGFEGYEETFQSLIASGQVNEFAGQQMIQEFQEARDVYKETRSDEGQFLSLSEASVNIAEVYPKPADLMPGEAETPERVLAMAAWMRTQDMIGKQKAAFDASPFDFTAKAAEKTYQAMVAEGTITGNETIDRIDAQRAAAQRKGGFNNTQASKLPVTTLEERNNINAQYNSLESISDKTEWYNEMSAKYGKYWPQAMADANIGFGIAIAAQIPTNNPQLRAAALMADSKKLSDYNLTDVDAKNLKALVTTKLNKDEGFFGVINAIAASRFDDEGMVTMRDNIRETVTKMVAHYQSEGLSSKDALAKVMDSFKQMAPANIIDDDLANLSIPKEYNQYAITRGLLLFKEAMGGMWDFDPQSGEQWQGSTFFRNHEDGIIWDSPGDTGLFLTWDEANEWGQRASTRQRIGRGQIISEREGGLRGAAKSPLPDAVVFINAKLAEGSAKPDPVAQVGILPSRERKALAEKTKKAAKEKVL